MKKKMQSIMAICFAIVVVELIIMFVVKISRERGIDRINLLNDIIKVDDGYIVAGASDFHNSKSVSEVLFEYTNKENNKKQDIIATQSRIAKYDDKMNLVWENTFPNKYDSIFYSVVKTIDGYIAVGSMVQKYEQIDANTRTALIVKYDLNGQKVWENTYSVLSDTEFYKIINDDDNFVVVGQSIYENLEMGTHITGGGIIVRYDKDGKELAHNNYGGNKSGLFNDIIKVNDGYIVCGKDAANYGIIVKFKKDFNRDEKDLNLITKKVMWQRTYANTDNDGFKGMALVNNKIFAVGALNVSGEKDSEGNTIFKYVAGFVVYDINGKYVNKVLMGDDTHNQFNSVVEKDNKLYLSTLLDLDDAKKNKVQKSAVIQYELEENKFMDTYKFDGNNNYIVNKLTNIDNKIFYVGTENNKCGFYGCDFKDVMDYFDK